MANFEAFCWVISSSINLLFLKSDRLNFFLIRLYVLLTLIVPAPVAVLNLGASELTSHVKMPEVFKCNFCKRTTR